MIAALAFGFVIGHVRDADKMAFYQIHESIGATLFLVTLARLWVRLRIHRRRIHPGADGAGGGRGACAAVCRAAGAAAAGLHRPWGFPMAGPTAYLGVINQPPFMAKNEALGTLLLQLHQRGSALGHRGAAGAARGGGGLPPGHPQGRHAAAHGVAPLPSARAGAPSLDRAAARTRLRLRRARRHMRPGMESPRA